VLTYAEHVSVSMTLVSTAKTQQEPERASAPRPGVIYILMNPHMPDLIKIGRTERTSPERAAEISRATGVPAEFNVVYDAVVTDCAQVESLIHQDFASRRVTRNREFLELHQRRQSNRFRDWLQDSRCKPKISHRRSMFFLT
jgi:T5orf172 domain